MDKSLLIQFATIAYFSTGAILMTALDSPSMMAFMLLRSPLPRSALYAVLFFAWPLFLLRYAGIGSILKGAVEMAAVIWLESLIWPFLVKWFPLWAAVLILAGVTLIIFVPLLCGILRIMPKEL